MNALPAGTVTFLFTDIEGSTTLWDRQRKAMRAALAQHDAILRVCTEKAGGVVFKTVGDAFCCAFERPSDAIDSAIEIQRGLAEAAWPEPIKALHVRMAIHSGDAVERGGDYYGPAMNRVSRLMSLAHGAQVLVSQTTALIVRDDPGSTTSLRDLGVHRLRDLSQPEHVYQLLAEGLRSDFPDISSLDSIPNNLPWQISSFVGRDKEVTEASSLLQNNRLVTVAGAGGIGKTRLALHVAADVLHRFSDGCYFIELAPIRDSEFIDDAVCKALSIEEVSGESLEDTLLASLEHRRLLLVLDNSEHILSAVGAFIKTLLKRCADVYVLTTSREQLHLSGERVLRLGPLGVPARVSTLADLQRSDGPRLFIERARAARSDISLADRDVADIVAICERLDGIPLAIELAAARTSGLPLPELRERLSKPLGVLISKDPSEEQRHSTLRETITWSYDLLNEPEQRLLALLSVFRAGFTAAAAEAVCESGEVNETLESLVDKSFLTIDFAQTKQRYSMMDAIREFAAEKAAALNATARLRERHFTFFSSLAAEEQTRTGDQQAQWLAEMERDVHNLRDALAFGLARKDPATLPFLRDIARYWIIRGQISEAYAWLGRALAIEEFTDLPLYPAILRRASTFATINSDHESGRRLAMEALERYRAANNRGGIGEAYLNLGIIEQRAANSDAAAELYAQALEHLRASENVSGTLTTLTNLAQIAMGRHDLDEAESLLGESVALSEKLGDPDRLSSVLIRRGSLLARKGNLPAAEADYLQSLRVKSSLGNSPDMILIFTDLASLYNKLGRLDDAEEASLRSVELARDFGSPAYLARSIESLAVARAAAGRSREAAQLLGLATRMRESSHFWQSTDERVHATVEQLRSQLGEDYEIARREGERQDWRAVVDEILALRARASDPR